MIMATQSTHTDWSRPRSAVKLQQPTQSSSKNGCVGCDDVWPTSDLGERLTVNLPVLANQASARGLL